jgi:hypothetical protein
VSTSSSSHRCKSSCTAVCSGRRPNRAPLTGDRCDRNTPKSVLRCRHGTQRPAWHVATHDRLVAGYVCSAQRSAMMDFPITQLPWGGLFEPQSNCTPSRFALRGETRRESWRSDTSSRGSLAPRVNDAHRLARQPSAAGWRGSDGSRQRFPVQSVGNCHAQL